MIGNRYFSIYRAVDIETLDVENLCGNLCGQLSRIDEQ